MNQHLNWVENKFKADFEMIVQKYAFHANVYSDTELIYSCGIESYILDSANIVCLDLMGHLKPGFLFFVFLNNIFPSGRYECPNLETCSYQMHTVSNVIVIIALRFFITI